MSSGIALALFALIMKKLNSPIPWVGGKSRLRDSIISLIPDHVCYAEVFAGAAWVYFGKQPSKVEAINDINGDLVNLYQTIKTKPEEFFEALWYMFPSRQLYQNANTILTSDAEKQILTDVERAVLFYYAIRNAFGAKFKGGFAYATGRPPKMLIGMDFLIDLRERLAKTYVENLSFERFIKNYDRPDTFFYCDPPYVVADKRDHYQFVFDEEKHHQLHDSLAKAKGKWLLSYDDAPLVRSLYKCFKIRKTDPIPYSLNNRRSTETIRKQELLISNY